MDTEQIIAMLAMSEFNVCYENCIFRLSHTSLPACARFRYDRGPQPLKNSVLLFTHALDVYSTVRQNTLIQSMILMQSDQHDTEAQLMSIL